MKCPPYLAITALAVLNICSPDLHCRSIQAQEQKPKKAKVPDKKTNFTHNAEDLAVAEKIAKERFDADEEKACEDLDSGVLDAVLTHLMSKDMDTPIYLRTDKTSGKKELDFSLEPIERRVTVSSVLDSPDPKLWNKLSKEQIRGAVEGAGVIVRRLEVKGAFKNLTVQNPSIRLRTKEESQGYKYHPWLVTSRRPGYSSDKKLAIVQVHYAWSLHPADAVYVLQRTEKGWRIILHQHCLYV